MNLVRSNLSRARAVLLAGTATLSLTVGTLASEYSNIIVFGDRYLDAGQYVDPDVAFDNAAAGDGRLRFTNRVNGGDYGYPYSDVLSNHFGFGDTAPSQPQSTPVQIEEGVVPETGTNYAGGFFNNQEIYNSIANPVSVLPAVTYGSGGARVVVDGTTSVGILADAERRAWLPNSIVLIGGGTEDVRFLANVDLNLDGTVDLGSRTQLNEDRAANNTYISSRADLIRDGAILLRDAGANTVIVSNLFDQGQMPESKNVVDSAQLGLTQVNTTIAATLAADPAANVTALQAQRDMFQRIIDNPDLVRSIRSDATTDYNAALQAGLNGEAGILVIDHKSIIDEVMNDPARFGLNAELDQESICFGSSVLYPCELSGGAPTETFFDNGIDLTQAGHGILGDQIKAVLDAPVHVNAIPLAAMSSGRTVLDTVEAQITPERIRKRGWAPFVSAGIGRTLFNEIENEGDQDVDNLTGVAGVTFTPAPGIAVGAALSYQDISDPAGDQDFGYEGDAAFVSVFAGLDKGRLFANASAAIGKADYDSVNRNSLIGAGQFTNTGKTEADVYGGSVEVGFRAYTYNTVAVGPIASVDHWSAEADGYTESGWDVTSMTFSKLEAESTRASVGMFLEAGSLDYEAMPVVFRGKALYTHELGDSQNTITAALTSNPGGTFSRPGRAPVDSAVTVGMQLSYKLGPVIGSIGYDGRYSDTVDHAGRVDVSLPFHY